MGLHSGVLRILDCWFWVGWVLVWVCLLIYLRRCLALRDSEGLVVEILLLVFSCLGSTLCGNVCGF